MSGTYSDKQAPKVAMGLFLAVALVLVLVPSVGMLWARTDTTTENRELAPAPALTDADGAFSMNVLSDAGTYFNDHFAFRNQLVAANAHLRALLGASATDQVVVGSDEWLYYAGTLNDYLGRSALSDRSLANIAHNLKLVQGYVESKGAAFVFAVAPNKNTLYDANMPSYYVRCTDASNAERLKPLLEQAGVNYVDLFDLIGGQDEVLYLLRDTHWDNRGALMVANALLQAVGHAAAPADSSAAVVRDDFVGDLQDMLYPGEGRTEPNYYYEGVHEQASPDGAVTWKYESGSDVTDSLVQAAGAGAGSLYMFRDSFANALLPFMAAAFDTATFSKLVPYNIPAITQGETSAVIIERAERHIPDLATDPPFLPSPTLRFANGLPDGAHEAQATLDIREDGSYWVVRATVEEQIGPETRLYLNVQQGQSAPVVYDPFWVSFAGESGEVAGDNGLLAYIPVSSVDIAAASVRVYVK